MALGPRRETREYRGRNHKDDKESKGGRSARREERSIIKRKSWLVARGGVEQLVAEGDFNVRPCRVESQHLAVVSAFRR